jgi:hypothetical protein
MSSLPSREGEQLVTSEASTVFYTCSCNNTSITGLGTLQTRKSRFEQAKLFSTNTLMSSNTLMDDLDGRDEEGEEGTYNMEEKPRFFN